MEKQDTIYALSTIKGRSGVAVIRISGDEVKDVLQMLTFKTSFNQREATYCAIKSPITGEILDKAIVIFFNGPNSFTGEDIAELHLHGSIAVIDDVMEVLSTIEGLRIAEPGEFTRRAFENGKMDLIDVEALGDLIHAETSVQRRTAINQMSGQLKSLYNKWREVVVDVMAQIEAYIDFPDDDIPESALKHATNSVKELVDDIEKHLAVSEKAAVIMNGLQIAIGGAPNVGKSTLMNLLARQEVAIVSNIAGTTRDIIQVNMKINGIGITLYDTAGIHEKTRDSIEQEGIRRAKEKLKASDIKIYVVDILNVDIEDENFLQNLQSQIMKNLNDSDMSSCIVLLNKCDAYREEDQNIMQEIANNNQALTTIPFSASTGYNLDQLLERIQDIISERYSIRDDMIITTQHRQKQKLLECLSHLKSFDLIGKPMEIAAQDIRLASSAMESIVGEITLDDVLDKIFSTFCIGK